MKITASILLCSILLFIGCEQQAQGKKDKESYLFSGERHLSNVRMLTEGGENAEAYFSFDQTRLVYQAKVGNFECDQIYTMKLDGSENTMVSTGKGRTTCSFFMPGDSTVVYASTHLDNDACPPPPDRSHGYVWQLYDSFDIFVADREGNIVKRLTDTPGYDAEAVVSPRGDKIAFTTTRDGDPEIYTMDLDGGNQKRLTNLRGYDGGPFFSPDGSQIVFRASRPRTPEEQEDYNELVEKGYVRPTALEIYVMDVDGENIRQVTNLGKASFAPYFHPDGKRIIFSSNINSKSGRNFDLYIVNVDGSGLEQVTFNETFDGFPMFTRDGKQLVFGSNRFNKNKGDTNIFLADWVD